MRNTRLGRGTTSTTGPEEVGLGSEIAEAINCIYCLSIRWRMNCIGSIDDGGQSQECLLHEFSCSLHSVGARASLPRVPIQTLLRPFLARASAAYPARTGYWPAVDLWPLPDRRRLSQPLAYVPRMESHLQGVRTFHLLSTQTFRHHLSDEGFVRSERSKRSEQECICTRHEDMERHGDRKMSTPVESTKRNELLNRVREKRIKKANMLAQHAQSPHPCSSSTSLLLEDHPLRSTYINHDSADIIGPWCCDDIVEQMKC